MVYLDGDPEQGLVIKMQSGDQLIARGCVGKFETRGS